MESINFDINDALKHYMSDPAAIATPEADSALVDCESDPEALSNIALINPVLNPQVEAQAIGRARRISQHRAVSVETLVLKDSGGTANGGADASATATFTITVRAINDAPVATDDSANTPKATAITLDSATLLSNDRDVDGEQE